MKETEENQRAPIRKTISRTVTLPWLVDKSRNEERKKMNKMKVKMKRKEMKEKKKKCNNKKLKHTKIKASAQRNY